MFPYWVLFGVIAVGSILHARLPAAIYRPGLAFILAMVGVVLMIGLRFEVGGDWFSYTAMLKQSAQMTYWGAIGFGDPGYMTLNWLAGRTGLGIWAVNTACAIIFVWGLARLSLQQPNPWLAVLVAVPYMIIVVAMGYTRQGAALGLLMAALARFHEQSLGRFFANVVLAVTFHRTAIVFVPFGLLSVTRNRFVIGGLSIVLAASLYFAFVSERLDLLIHNYVDSAYSSQGAATRIAMGLVPALLFIVFRKRFALSPAQSRLYLNMSLATFVAALALFVSEASTAIDRLALYLLPLQLVVLTRVPQFFSRTRENAVFMTALIVLYLAAVQFVWLNYAANAKAWLPYKMIGFAG